MRYVRGADCPHVDQRSTFDIEWRLDVYARGRLYDLRRVDYHGAWSRTLNQSRARLTDRTLVGGGG